MLRKLFNPSCDFKLDDTKKGYFEGYASKFGGVDAYGDTIIKGAYEKTIKDGGMLPGFINHDSSGIPVIDWTSLKEDDIGLHGKAIIDMNHKDGPSAYSAIVRGAMTGLSIGYTVPKGGGVENDHGGLDLKEIGLKEISLVNYPADDAARILVVKADVEIVNTLKDMEKFLRDSGGYSKSAAMALVSRMKYLSQSDSGLNADEITKRHIDRNTDRLIQLFKR